MKAFFFLFLLRYYDVDERGKWTVRLAVVLFLCVRAINIYVDIHKKRKYKRVNKSKIVGRV